MGSVWGIDWFDPNRGVAHKTHRPNADKSSEQSAKLDAADMPVAKSTLVEGGKEHRGWKLDAYDVFRANLESADTLVSKADEREAHDEQTKKLLSAEALVAQLEETTGFEVVTTTMNTSSGSSGGGGDGKKKMERGKKGAEVETETEAAVAMEVKQVSSDENEDLSTVTPTSVPTMAPSREPSTSAPTRMPSSTPSSRPSAIPTALPTGLPTPDGSGGVAWYYVVQVECIFWRKKAARRTTYMYRAASNVFNFMLGDLLKASDKAASSLSVQVINSAPINELYKNEEAEDLTGTTAGTRRRTRELRGGVDDDDDGGGGGGTGGGGDGSEGGMVGGNKRSEAESNTDDMASSEMTAADKAKQEKEEEKEKEEEEEGREEEAEEKEEEREEQELEDELKGRDEEAVAEEHKQERAERKGHRNRIEPPDDAEEQGVEMYTRCRIEVWTPTHEVASRVLAAVRQIKWNSELLVTPMHEQGTKDVVQTTLGRPHVVVTREQPPLQLPSNPKLLFYVIGGTILIFCLMWYCIHHMRQKYHHVKDPFQFFTALFSSLLNFLTLGYAFCERHRKTLAGGDDDDDDDDDGSLVYGMDAVDTDEEDLGLLADRLTNTDSHGGDVNISASPRRMQMRPSSTQAQARRKNEGGHF